MLDTLSRPGGRLQTARCGDLAVLRPAGLAAQPPDPAQLADAVARDQAYQALREFRARLYACLTSRPAASTSYSAPCPRRNCGTSDSWTSEVTA